jgi:hypothetical protein
LRVPWPSAWRSLASSRKRSAQAMSNQSGTWMDLIYASPTPGTAKSGFTTEVAINDTAGMGPVAVLQPNFFLPGYGIQKAIRIIARGILSSTATPTYTFTVRLGAQGSITAAIILGSAAITTGAGVTNQIFEFEGDVVMRIVGAAGANSTAQGVGLITSPGLATPFMYPLYGGAATPGTVATIDTSIANYVNFNVACSANSGSNSVTLQQLLVVGLN